MKRFNKFLIPLLAAGIFTGCNWQIPKSISVASDAEYRFSMGTLAMDLSDYLDSNELLKSMKANMGNNASVFDINRDADDDTLTYMVHYPIYNIPFDIQQYLKSVNFDENLNFTAMTDIGQSITIPALSVENKYEETISELLGDLVSDIKSQTIELPLSAYETGTPSYLEVYQDINVESHFAKGVKYKEGSSIVFSAEKLDSNPEGAGFEVLCKVVIPSVTIDGYTYTGFESNYFDITDGEVLEIPLDRGYVPYELPITVYCKYKGGQLASPMTKHDYKAVFSMENAVIEEIAEINLAGGVGDDPIEAPVITLDEVNIPAPSLPSEFINATIGSGEVSFIAPMPAGWSNLGFELTSLSLNGMGISITESDFLGDSTGYLINKKAELAGQTITSGGSDITVNCSFKVNCDGATIKLDNLTKIETSLALNITELAEINLDASGFSYKFEDEGAVIQSTVKEYVNRILFQDPLNPGKKHISATELADGDGFGFKCNLVNSLPLGNNIPVTVTSDIFGLKDSNKIQAILSGTGDESPVETKINSYPEIVLEEGKIDLNIDFGSEKTINGTDYKNCLTLSEIVPGQNYAFEISDISLLCDWESIDLRLPKTKVMEVDMDFSQVNIKEMLSSLPLPEEDLRKLSVSSIKTYFYAQKPDSEAISDILGKISFTGNVYCTYTDSNSVEKEISVFNEGEEIHFANPVPWPDNNESIVDYKNHPEFLSCLTDENASFTCDLADVFNEFPSELRIGYNLKLQSNNSENIKLSSYQLNNLAEEDVKKVSLDIVLELPLAFDVDGKISIDLKKLMQIGGAEEPEVPRDLLNRESASTPDFITEALDTIDYFKVEYDLENNVINGLTGRILLSDEASGLNKSASFENGEHELKLTSDEIVSVLTTYPFNPSFVVEFGQEGKKSEMMVSRSGMRSNAGIKCKLHAGLKLDGNTPIEVFNIADVENN